MKNSSQTTPRYLILVGLLVGAIAFLWYIRPVINPLIIAALLAYILNPLVNWLTARTSLSRPWVVSISYLVGLAAIVLLPILLLPQLLNEIEGLIEDLLVLFNNTQDFIARPVNILQWTIRLDQLLPDFTALLSESLAQVPANALHLIESATRNFIWILVILVTTYYLLKDWPRLRDWILALPTPAYHEDARRIHQEIKEVWRGYLRGNLVLMLIVGVAFTIAWAALGVPGALILGVIAGLLTIIPDLGPFIAALIAIAVALVEGSTYLPLSNFWFAVLITIVYITLINIKSIYIRPRVFGRSVHMHEGLVFVSIMAAVILAGVLGALIVVPLLVSVGIIVRYLYRLALGQPPWPEPEEESG